MHNDIIKFVPGSTDASVASDKLYGLKTSIKTEQPQFFSYSYNSKEYVHQPVSFHEEQKLQNSYSVFKKIPDTSNNKLYALKSSIKTENFFRIPITLRNLHPSVRFHEERIG